MFLVQLAHSAGEPNSRLTPVDHSDPGEHLDSLQYRPGDVVRDRGTAAHSQTLPGV
jgi:hypothetical protein